MSWCALCAAVCSFETLSFDLVDLVFTFLQIYPCLTDFPMSKLTLNRSIVSSVYGTPDRNRLSLFESTVSVRSLRLANTAARRAFHSDCKSKLTTWGNQAEIGWCTAHRAKLKYSRYQNIIVYAVEQRGVARTQIKSNWDISPDYRADYCFEPTDCVLHVTAQQGVPQFLWSYRGATASVASANV